MAFKGTKRAASKAAGADRKKAGGSVAKKCRTLVATIRSAEDVPKPVRSMLCDNLVRIFSTYKEDRHPLQATFSKLLGDILNGAQSKLHGAIADAEQKHEFIKTGAATLISTHNAAAAKSEAAAKVLIDSKAGVADLKVALKDAKSSLHNLEVEGKTADSEAAATTTRKAKLEALALHAIREGTQHGALAGRHVGKELASNSDSFGKEFLECVTKTFSKPASAWGTFDHLIDKKLEESLKGVITGLTSGLEAMASAKETRSAQIEALTGAVVVAEEKVKAMEEACANAAVSAKEAENEAKTATTAAMQEQFYIQKAVFACNHAEAALAAFVVGPLAAFTEVEARAAPPLPAPELDKPEETAPLVDAVMEPAPPAAERKAPAVLPSPGVLSRAAQAVGLAPSPRAA